jgi:hypothetical protein
VVVVLQRITCIPASVLLSLLLVTPALTASAAAPAVNTPQFLLLRTSAALPLRAPATSLRAPAVVPTLLRASAASPVLLGAPAAHPAWLWAPAAAALPAAVLTWMLVPPDDVNMTLHWPAPVIVTRRAPQLLLLFAPTMLRTWLLLLMLLLLAPTMLRAWLLLRWRRRELLLVAALVLRLIFTAAAAARAPTA